VRGRAPGIRAQGPDARAVHRGEEVIRADDAYYLQPGHVPCFEEYTEVVEFNTKDAYQNTLDVAARNIAAMTR
jgi:hypothetical protein